MNGMSNLPQIYQDIMRSHPFAAAAAAAQLANNQSHLTSSSSSSSSSSTSSLSPNNTNKQFNLPQMTAAAAALQQQQLFQHQHNTMAAMAAMSALSNATSTLKNKSQPSSNFVTQLQQSILNNPFNNHHAHQTQQVMLANLIHATSAKTGGPTPGALQPIPHSSQLPYSPNPYSQFPFQVSNESKKTKLNNDISNIDNLHYNDSNKRKKNLPNQNNITKNNNLNLGLNRGRGRPPRVNNNDSKNNSLITSDVNGLNKSVSSGHPNSRTSSSSPNRSRSGSNKSRSPRPILSSNEFKSKSKENINNNNSTRTSTPSKLNQNQNEQDDVYSSIYDGDEEHINIENDMDDSEEGNHRSRENVDDEEIDLEDEELNEDELDEEENDEDLDEEALIDEDEDGQVSTTNSCKSKSRSNKFSKSSLITTKSKSSTMSHQSNNLQQPAHQINRPIFDFTLQALEMSLYGYLRQNDPLFAGHAISGLRIPQTFDSLLQPSLQHQLIMQNNVNIKLKSENLSNRG